MKDKGVSGVGLVVTVDSNQCFHYLYYEQKNTIV